MERRHPFDPKDRNKVQTFAVWVEEQTKGYFPQDHAIKVLDNLIRDESRLYDLWVDDQRVGCAALMDLCENAANSAELSLFGELTARRFHQWVAWAENLVQQTQKDTIELPEWPGNTFPDPWLKQAGFELEYLTHQMRRSPHPVGPAPPLPPGLSWADYSPRYLESYHETVTHSLGALPGAFVPAVQNFGDLLDQAPYPPQLILEGDRVAAFIRCSNRDRGGELTALGRHPDYRGRGLGPCLVHRGIAQMEQAGRHETYLDVVGTNAGALKLYESFGFRPCREIRVFQKTVPHPSSP